MMPRVDILTMVKRAKEFGYGQGAVAPVPTPVTAPPTPVQPVQAPTKTTQAPPQTSQAPTKTTQAPPQTSQAPIPAGQPVQQPLPPAAPAPAATTPNAPAPAAAPPARLSPEEAGQALYKNNDLEAWQQWAKGTTGQEQAIARRAAVVQGAVETAQATHIPYADRIARWQVGRMSQDDVDKTFYGRAQQRGTQMGQQIADAAKTDWSSEKGGLGNYLMQNPSMLLLPLGLMLTLGSRSNMGKLLGVLAAAGGAGNLYSRYKGLQDPTFLKSVQQMVVGKKSGQWSPEQDQQFQQAYGDRWRDLQAASASGMVKLPEIAGARAVDMLRPAPGIAR